MEAQATRVVLATLFSHATANPRPGVRHPALLARLQRLSLVAQGAREASRDVLFHRRERQSLREELGLVRLSPARSWGRRQARTASDHRDGYGSGGQTLRCLARDQGLGRQPWWEVGCLDVSTILRRLFSGRVGQSLVSRLLIQHRLTSQSVASRRRASSDDVLHARSTSRLLHRGSRPYWSQTA